MIPDFGITTTTVILGIGAPAWVSPVVGLLAGWAMPRVEVSFGVAVGFVVGMVSLSVMVWTIQARFDNHLFGTLFMLWGITLAVSVIVPIGACWWMSRTMQRKSAGLQ